MSWHCIMAAINITGQRFGRLVAIEPISERQHGQIVWRCKCDCGTITYVPSRNLRTGRSQSCGCAGRLPKGEAAFNDLYNKYKGTARRRGYSWSLTKAQFKRLTQSNCFYCGSAPYQIHRIQRGNGEYTYIGIDRVNNEKGYHIRNVVPCCKKCNNAKHVMSKDEFFAHVLQIYHNWIEPQLQE